MPIKDPQKRAAYYREYQEKNKESKRERQKIWRQNNIEKCRAYGRKHYANNREKCRQQCKQWYDNNKDKRLAWVSKNRERLILVKREWRKKNIDKSHEYEERYRRTHPERRENVDKWKRIRLSVPKNRIIAIVKSARSRAKNKGLTFDESLFALANDPPEMCVCCNKALDYSMPRLAKGEHRRSSRPSLDRIDNTKGYIVDNVAIVCMKCNAIKNDATIEELELIIKYMKTH